MENPFFPAPPRHLKKCLRGVRLVTRVEAALHMGQYNIWVMEWNRQEERFQSSKSNVAPKHDSPHGHLIFDMGRPEMWLWRPTDGPWHLVVDHEFNTQREFPLYIRAKLRGYKQSISPREFVSPDQIVWAAWLNPWRDPRPTV